jgi:hypothetical protein
MAIGCHCGLPLIARAVSQPCLRNEPGSRQRCLNRRKCKQQCECNFLHSAATAINLAGDRIHEIVPQKPCPECTVIPPSRQSCRLRPLRPRTRPVTFSAFNHPIKDDCIGGIEQDPVFLCVLCVKRMLKRQEQSQWRRQHSQQAVSGE